MKVGDKVAIIGSLGVVKVAPIDRETKLYWCIGDVWRFRKSNLYAPSSGCGYSSSYRIELATQKHIDELKKRRLVNELSETKWSKLDLETLEKVFAAVKRND